jgi:hypothetical protein
MAIYFLRWARHQSRNAINPTKPRLRFGISQSNSAMALPSRFLTRCFDTGELSQWLRFTTARVPTGSLQTQASGSATQNNICHTPTARPRWSHRRLNRRSTRHGDVPPQSPKRSCGQPSPQALQAPLQDPGRDKKTSHHLNENGHRLAAYGDLASTHLHALFESRQLEFSAAPPAVNIGGLLGASTLIGGKPPGPRRHVLFRLR